MIRLFLIYLLPLRPTRTTRASEKPVDVLLLLTDTFVKGLLLIWSKVVSRFGWWNLHRRHRVKRGGLSNDLLVLFVVRLQTVTGLTPRHHLILKNTSVLLMCCCHSLFSLPSVHSELAERQVAV